MTVLSISGLKVDIHSNTVLHDIDLTLEPGRILGVVGESGSGKSMTALSVMQLLPHGSRWSGSIKLAGTELGTLDEPALCKVRGRDVGMIFQEPMTALNPVRTIGDQVAETVRIHTGASRREAFSIAREMLDRVGLPEDRFPLDRFPHDLSGGQRQRVVIAQAIALRPKLLIADEPTTALDVTTQAQILDLLRELVREEDMGLMLITHDLAVVAGLADSIAIMKNGAVVEAGPTREIFRAMRHPYTRALFSASAHVPDRGRKPESGKTPVLAVENVVRDYQQPRRKPVCHARHRSAPWTMLASRSAARRERSAWWANPAAASQRLPARSWRLMVCRAATSGSTAMSFPAPVKVPTRNSGPGCRWCFRIPTVPSTRATVCEGS